MKRLKDYKPNDEMSSQKYNFLKTIDFLIEQGYKLTVNDKEMKITKASYKGLECTTTFFKPIANTIEDFYESRYGQEFMIDSQIMNKVSFLDKYHNREIYLNNKTVSLYDLAQDLLTIQ